MNVSGVNDIGSHANEAVYDSTFTYAMSSPLDEAVEVPSEAYYYGSPYYDSSTPFQQHDGARYDAEIRLDEEQPQTAASQNQQNASCPSDDHYSQQTNSQYYYPQTPAQEPYRPQTPTHNSQQNVPTSPTTVRWTGEYSAEERLRLGLPRYLTEEEVEEQRRAYEHTTQQADRPEPAPHAG
jgi:hypothetical protein